MTMKEILLSIRSAILISKSSFLFSAFNYLASTSVLFTLFSDTEQGLFSTCLHLKFLEIDFRYDTDLKYPPGTGVTVRTDGLHVIPGTVHGLWQVLWRVVILFN